MYNVWVCIHKKNEWIVTANCSCMTGLGSACSHVAAVLFKIEKAIHHVEETLFLQHGWLFIISICLARFRFTFCQKDCLVNCSEKNCFRIYSAKSLRSALVYTFSDFILLVMTTLMSACWCFFTDQKLIFGDHSINEMVARFNLYSKRDSLAKVSITSYICNPR